MGAWLMAILSDSGGKTSAKPLTQEQIKAQVAVESALAAIQSPSPTIAAAATPKIANPTAAFTGLTTQLASSATSLDALNKLAQTAANPQPLTQAQLDAATKQDYDVAVAAAKAAGTTPPVKPVIPDTKPTDTTVKPPSTTAVSDDAFQILLDQLNQWGLGGLADAFTRLATAGLKPQEALNKLKYDKTIDPVTGKAWNAAYTLRFAGNQARLDKGLNALSEGQYIANENAYAETLKAYGLNNMLSTDRATNEAKFATYIGNDLSPTEFKDRIDLAATRVINMDPAIQKNFQQYYPDVTKSDLISYFLAPDETLPLLKTKVSASEIGAAAGQQGLSVGVNRAEEFAKLGETYAQAQSDYSKIAEVLPTANKLSSIYGEEGIAYGQNVAEDEFIKQDAAAKLKRNRLASKERAMFGGDSGLSSQFSSLGSSIQGKF
jgi:hypothetical protein